MRENEGKGKMMTEEQAKKRNAAEASALAYLAHGMRTEWQVRRHLSEKGYSEEIGETIRYLSELGYLDDEKYALLYLEHAVGKRHGLIRIRMELKRRGIENEVFEKALSVYRRNRADEGETFEERIRAAEEAVRIAEGIPLSDKLIGKVGRRLQTLGYDTDSVYYAVGVMIRRKKEYEE